VNDNGKLIPPLAKAVNMKDYQRLPMLALRIGEELTMQSTEIKACKAMQPKEVLNQVCSSSSNFLVEIL
jgi:hypothetical protein